MEENARNLLAVAYASQVTSLIFKVNLQTNAIPTAFWVIAYVACLKEQKQEVFSRIQEHVLPDESTLVPSFKVTNLLQDSLLNSAVSETLRKELRSLSVREVCEDTTLTINGKPFTLEKGAKLFLSMINVHKDPAIYECPHEFRLKRFVKMHEGDGSHNKVFFSKNGAPIRHPFIPFGGGHFMVKFRLT